MVVSCLLTGIIMLLQLSQSVLYLFHKGFNAVDRLHMYVFSCLIQ